MKRFVILITVGWMICVGASAWGGARFTTKLEFPSIGAGLSVSQDLKLPTAVARAVKITGGMNGDQPGSFNVAIYSNVAQDSEDELYNVTGLIDIINDDTPVYLTSEHTSLVASLKLTNLASLPRSMTIMVITESMSSKPLTND